MKRDDPPPVETFEEACRRNPAPPTTPEQYRRTAEILRTAKPTEQAS